MITFNLNGWMVSGKNSVKGDPVDGHKYPNPRFEKWRNMMSRQVWVQRQGLKVLFKKPTRVEFRVDYWRGDNRRRDIPGMMDALFHLMECCNIVEDDAQFVRCLGWEPHDMDRTNPRLIFACGPI